LMAPEQAFVWGEGVAVETPHIDWIGKNGAVCTSFYATTPVCSPSRASLVSGRYPQNTDVVTNNIRLRGDVVTFAELLKREGYATGYFGKWHLEGAFKPGWAPRRKFGFEDNRYMFNRGHWKKFEETAAGPRVAARKGREASYGVDGAEEKSFATDWLCDRAMEFVDGVGEKPWCAMISLPDPHGPDTVRAPYDTMFADLKGKAPRTFTAAGPVPAWGEGGARFQDMGKYLGMVKCIDDNVGEILAKLRESGQLERTVIVFTSDHGDLRGEHGRQNKGVPYEGSARVPFLVYCEGVVKAGTVVGEALGTVDFLPTVMGLMGNDVPAEVKAEGRDASGLLRGEKTDWEDVAFLRGTGEKNSWLAAVTDRYKLVVAPKDTPWLFDLEEDPDEMVNFWGKRDVGASLMKKLRGYAERYGDERLGMVEKALGELTADGR
ncbi:MAG: sulfatase-like hydrolase/transferase, partial [Verrucomicrobiales bacterium]|nr:sulfatase-like hydrolase/transferase [Verrucomicrobiales bacterium]